MPGRKHKRCDHYQVFDIVAESDHMKSRHICNCAVLLKTLECVVSRCPVVALLTLVLSLMLIENMMQLIQELSVEYLC